MQRIIKLLFSPMAFAVGFLIPLIAQVLIAAGVDTGVSPWLIAGVVGLGLGIMAQVRGSWIWVKP